MCGRVVYCMTSVITLKFIDVGAGHFANFGVSVSAGQVARPFCHSTTICFPFIRALYEADSDLIIKIAFHTII